MEWNDLRDEIGTCSGTYENPPDLSAQSWTLMRFTEYENPKGDLEWLIRKDGCMHCADPGCLKACPAPGAIVQYANGIVDFHEDRALLSLGEVRLSPARRSELMRRLRGVIEDYQSDADGESTTLFIAVYPEVP